MQAISIIRCKKKRQTLGISCDSYNFSFLNDKKIVEEKNTSVSLGGTFNPLNDNDYDNWVVSHTYTITYKHIHTHLFTHTQTHQ